MTARTCPNCAAVLPAGARFCPSCGASTGPRSDERRIVTVLFADVVGFTPLSEDRDPEHVKNLLDRCFERLASDISSHGGRVDKIVGDEIMAVFGAPVAHEDDPERAVRAALQMQRNLVEHAEETGADVRMRIGINTGEVVVGALRAGGDVTALGDVVNIAKRLQTAAEPGRILVGPGTFAATKDVISYEELGALTVKGRGTPVEAWNAVQPLGPPGVRPGRGRTPLVGRKSELALMWHALGTAVAHGRPHFVLIVGDAGMGKTVLVEEAIEMARIQHSALVIQGRCLPYGEANPWWPVAEALRQACEIDAEDPADVAAEKCRRVIGALIGAEDEGAEASRVADGLLYLMGYEETLPDLEPSRAREEAVRSIQVSLAAIAGDRPLVVVLSEIHWADKLVLDLVDSMFDRLRNLPILFIATARPELEERWAPKPGRHNLFVLNLDPLDRSEAAEYVRKLLGSEPPPEVVDLVIERSGGNPLFISELIAVMGETGFATSSTDRFESGEFPATLRGLVSARIDGLDRADRAVLEDASVIGRSGPIGALLALAEARGELDAKTRLATLTHRELLVAEGGEYEFKSDLVRDVAYETLTKTERARRHAAVGDWLASYAKRTEREEEHLERIAHHYANAAQLVDEVGAVEDVPGDVLDRAITWLDRAVARAEGRETVGVSIHLLEHALRLVGDSEPLRRAGFLLSRARGRAAVRDMDAAYADIAEVLTIADDADDRTLCARALTVRGEIEQKEGALDRSAATLEEAVSVWAEVGDRQGETEALRLWGFTSIHRGALDEAEHAISQALDISRSLDDRRGEAWALQNLAWASFVRGDFDAAEERLLASSKLFEEIGDFGGRSWAVGLLGYVWYFNGQLDRAASVAEPGVEFAREVGDRWAYGMMLNLLAGVRLWQGRTREAVDRATQAHRLFVEIDDGMGLAMSMTGLATGLVLLGRGDEAQALLDRSDRAPAGFGAPQFTTIVLDAFVATMIGDGAKAASVMSQVNEDDAALLATTALAQFVAGDIEKAYATASRAWALDPEESGDRAHAGCVRALTAAAVSLADEAIAASEEVLRVGGSYLDRIRAHLARAFATAQLGRDEHVQEALHAAREIVDGSDDEVHKALVRLAEATVVSARGAERGPDAEPINASRDRLEELGVSWRAWERAFRLAATGGRSQAIVAPAVE